MAETLIRSLHRRLWAETVLANGIGATIILSFLIFLVPVELPDEQRDAMLRLGLPVFFGYLLLSFPVAALLVEPAFRRIADWVRAGAHVSPPARRMVLAHPRRSALVTLGLWTGGGLGFGIVMSLLAPAALVAGGVETIVLAGLVTATLQYLAVERIMRPVAALALAGDPPQSTKFGVRRRLLLTWLLATGIPLWGIAVLSVHDLVEPAFISERVVAGVLVVSALGLIAGFAATLLTAKAVADPLVSMRDALDQVGRGDFTARVPVDDSTELGLLEAGFNRMTEGLAERERLHQAFGTFVDPAVAERVLREGTDLAGEEVEVSLLFLDVRDFTAFAEQSEAQHVVAMLNDLFALVVPVILRHGGHANKFVGDGLLAVFGAPERHEDHADRAVTAACEIAKLVLERYAGEPSVGIGVNTGKVVVGTVGGGGRLDFTVIGDAVNTAARVESATRITGDDVLITDTTRAQLADRGGWTERPAVPLKGKRAEVRLFGPDGVSAAGSGTASTARASAAPPG